LRCTPISLSAGVGWGGLSAMLLQFALELGMWSASAGSMLSIPSSDAFNPHIPAWTLYFHGCERTDGTEDAIQKLLASSCGSTKRVVKISSPMPTTTLYSSGSLQIAPSSLYVSYTTDRF